MINNKVQIIRDNGALADAQAPIIVSASRATDIPAFYSDWFLYRLKRGYSAWTNPFNGVRSFVSYEKTRLIVFWSKNPRHLLDEDGCLDYLHTKKINCYVQFTLNDYVREGLEKGVPAVDERIGTFKALVDRLGFGRVIWRFDPLILTNEISIEDLLAKIEYIGDRLKGYTEKLVFSYADIKSYKKVHNNLIKNNVHYREFSESDMNNFAARLAAMNTKWGYALATCGEKIDISQYGIQHNKCIDDDLIIKYFHKDSVLMNYLGVEIRPAGLFSEKMTIFKKKNNKDKGQRLYCGCIASKDIGEYNTCPHLCEYCYANSSKEVAVKNWNKHRNNDISETITGE